MRHFIFSASIITLIVSLSNAIVPIEEFYPFGASVGDANLEDTIPTPVNGVKDLDDGSGELKFKQTSTFHYFNEPFDTLWVNINGGVSFRGALRAFTPECAPLNAGMSMISPFWADVDLREHHGNVSYRETNDKSVLDKALTDVKTAFPHLESEVTSINWAFIATWYQVHFFDDKSPLTNKNKNNTFQLVLATGGSYSFAIFNYNKIDWTTGTHQFSGGNNDGLGGHPARAGFDNGDGRFYKIPGSCESAILNIASQSEKNLTPGKFVFQINKDIIAPGSTLGVITDKVSRDVPTEPITEATKPTETERQTEPTNPPTEPSTLPTETPTNPPTEAPTGAPTTNSDDFKKHKETTEQHLKDLRLRLEADCYRLTDEHLALEKECFHELRILNELEHELTIVKQEHELFRIDLELYRVKEIFEKIERAIAGFTAHY